MKAVFILFISVLFILSSCTKVDVVDLDITSNETINTTMFEKNESELDIGEEMEEIPQEVKEGLCTEKVLLALRKCQWDEDNANNLRIMVKNNGFKNLTMAFYLYGGEGQVGSIFNDSLFSQKEEWTYTLPLKDLEEVHGEIEKIHVTPLLTEGSETISCSNKKLPVLVRGCS